MARTQQTPFRVLDLMTLPTPPTPVLTWGRKLTDSIWLALPLICTSLIVLLSAIYTGPLSSILRLVPTVLTVGIVRRWPQA